MRGPIGYLERMKDAEIKALGRWLDADIAARLLGRSVRTVQRWGQDECLRSRGIWPRTYYYKLDVLTEFGFSHAFADLLCQQ